MRHDIIDPEKRQEEDATILSLSVLVQLMHIRIIRIIRINRVSGSMAFIFVHFPAGKRVSQLSVTSLLYSNTRAPFPLSISHFPIFSSDPSAFLLASTAHPTQATSFTRVSFPRLLTFDICHRA